MSSKRIELRAAATSPRLIQLLFSYQLAVKMGLSQNVLTHCLANTPVQPRWLGLSFSTRSFFFIISLRQSRNQSAKTTRFVIS